MTKNAVIAYAIVIPFGGLVSLFLFIVDMYKFLQIIRDSSEITKVDVD